MTSKQAGRISDNQRVSAASRSGAAELNPPRTLSARIERAFLEAMVFDGLERQVVVIQALAGYGKTALMTTTFGLVTRYGAASQRAFSHKGWLTIGPRHADSRLLSRDLAAALGLRPPDGEADLAQILPEIAERPGRTVLFIDDIDSVPTEELADMLGLLVGRAPDKLRLVLASRSRMPFPLVQMRLRGLLTEIGPRHLSFSMEELRRVLDSAAPAELGLVAQATQGWPALVSLIADLLGTTDGGERGRLLTGLHPAISEFIEEMILKPIASDIRAAFASTAVVEDFSTEMASAMGGPVLQPADAAALADMEPVVTRSPIGPGWYRLHPVVRAHILNSSPLAEEEVRRRHAAAARWFAERGHLQQAVDNATQAADFNYATEIISKAGGVNLFLHVGHLVLERLIECLPGEVIYASPELTLCHALILAKQGRLGEADDLVRDLKGNRVANDAPAELAVALSHIAGMIRVYRDNDIPGLVAELEQRALTLRPTEAAVLAWVNTLLCTSYTALGEVELAKRRVMAAAAYYKGERSHYSLIFSHVHIGMINILAGNFAAAQKAAGQAQDLVQTTYWNDLALTAISYVPLAELAYLRGDAATAERLLTEATPSLNRGEGWVDIFGRAYLTLASARMQLRGPDAALAILDDAEELAAERGLPRLAIAADIARLDLLVRGDRIEPARHLMERLEMRLEGARAAHFPIWRQERDFALARARLAIALGRPEDALEAIGSLIAEREERGDSYHYLLAMLVSMRAHWALGDVAQTQAALRVAMAIALPQGLIQPFLDESPVMRATLRAIIRRVGLRNFSADAVEFLGRIVGNAVPQERGPAPRNADAVRAEGTNDAASNVLTPREHEILRHLVDSRSNKEIARILGVSDVTVKFHLKNIFVKLGVSRRDLAASVARRLNLC